MLWLIPGAAAIWVLLSVVIALALGRMVKLADTAEADARFARQIKRNLVGARVELLESVATAHGAS